MSIVTQAPRIRTLLAVVGLALLGLASYSSFDWGPLLLPQLISMALALALELGDSKHARDASWSAWMALALALPFVWPPTVLILLALITLAGIQQGRLGLRTPPSASAKTLHLRELATWGRALLVAGALAILSEGVGESVYNVSPSNWAAHLAALPPGWWLEPALTSALTLVLAFALSSGRAGLWRLALALFPGLLVLGFGLDANRIVDFSFLSGPVSAPLLVAGLLLCVLYWPCLRRTAQHPID